MSAKVYKPESLIRKWAIKTDEDQAIFLPLIVSIELYTCTLFLFVKLSKLPQLERNDNCNLSQAVQDMDRSR